MAQTCALVQSVDALIDGLLDVQARLGPDTVAVIHLQPQEYLALRLLQDHQGRPVVWTWWPDLEAGPETILGYVQIIKNRVDTCVIVTRV